MKKLKPLVSIIIPVYNGTAFLDECIDSILASSYQRFEIILIDDGSTDYSRIKCQHLAKLDKRIRFFYFRQNRGMTRCLNFAVKKAKGKYIARINQDDVMMPNRLQKQVAYLEKHTDVVCLGGSVQLFTKDNPKFDRIYFPTSDKAIKSLWLRLSPFADPAVMYRKSAWEQTEGYSQYFWPADDVHMWYQLGSIGKLANLRSVMTRVRWHQDAGSIKSHQRQMEKTWNVHQWASEMIQTPSISDYFFWLAESIAGSLFPAQFNWWVYRQIRKAQNKKTFSKTTYSFSLPTSLKKLNVLHFGA